jgi:3-dehydroquinate synthase
MVDAAIGGKTGMNFPLPESDDLGKNLIGAFWQPKLVLADPKVLLTLRRRDFVCGLAECIKHAAIADAALLQWLHDRAKDILALDIATWIELIARSAAIKASIVAEDEHEHGRRALLNLGHTFAHAIEALAGNDVRHGEAVALGLRAAAHVAISTRRMSADDAEHLNRTLAVCALPEQLPVDVSIDNLMRAMTFDKKIADGRMRLVLPRGIGAAEVVDDVPVDLVRHAWSRIGARP